MEKKLNPLDLTQVSKKQLDKSKRIEEQAAEFLKLHDQKLREEAALLEKKNLEKLASGASHTLNSSYVKNKNRAKAVQEAIGYNDKATRAVMTDVMTRIAENALLIDTAEYAKLNPSYKKEIREQVSSLLENGNLSTLIRDKRTVRLMEHIAKAIPDVKTGVYLKEEELIDIVKKSTPAEIENMISSLTGDVKERVANIVVKEQDDAAEIQRDVDQVMKTGGEARSAKDKELGVQQQQGGAQIPPEIVQILQSQGITMGPDGTPIGPDGQPVPPEVIQQILSQAMQQGGAPGADGQPSPEEAAAMQQQGGAQIPPEVAQILQSQGITMGPDGTPIGPDGQPVPPEVIQQILSQAMQQAPGTGITNPAPQFDEYGQEVEQAPAAAPQQSAAVPQTANRNTAVEISPDGTVKVNIVRERFYREHPRQGILESLALNEALDVVKSGKQYDGDLALAKAIAHLTVLEAFNVSGLMPISELDYKRMLNLPFRKKALKEEGEAAAKPVATTEEKPAEHTPEVKKDEVHSGEQAAEEVKAPLIEAKKLGSAAAKPIATKDAKPAAHKPEVKQTEVHKGEQKAEEVKAPLIEAKKNWKDKVKETLAKQESDKPWNKKIAEEKNSSKK
jgi:hypothetical protein